MNISVFLPIESAELFGHGAIGGAIEALIIAYINLILTYLECLKLHTSSQHQSLDKPYRKLVEKITLFLDT